MDYDHSSLRNSHYALIDASSSRISQAEKVEIILVGHPPEFDAVITLALFSSERLPFQRLVDLLLEYESRQLRALPEVLIHANLTESIPSPSLVESVRGGRPLTSGRGRGFYSRI